MNLPQLNLHLFALPDDVEPGKAITVADQQLETVRSKSIGGRLLDRSFEEVLQSLSQLENFYSEPDGFWVWARADGGTAWQLSGMLYDIRDQVQRIEVKGSIPLRDWKKFVDAIAPAEQLVAQMLELGVFVSLQDLARLWSADENS